jgi:peptide/nickel transport system substrate-binding protein
VSIFTRRWIYASAIAVLVIVIVGATYFATLHLAPSASTATTVTTVEEEPWPGKDPSFRDTLYVATTGPYEDLDPQTVGWGDPGVVGEMYDTLVTYYGNFDLTPKPCLASSWEISDNGTVYTFHLQTGVKFYPSGNELTAEDVKFSIERLKFKQIGFYWMIDGVWNRTEVVDRYTVRDYLNVPFAAWLSVRSHPAVGSIIEKAFVEAHGPDLAGERNDYISSHSGGSGPYYLAEHKPREMVVLEANPFFRGGWDGKHVKKVVLRVIDESATRMMLLARGDLDITTIDAKMLPELESRIVSENLPVHVWKEVGGRFTLGMQMMKIAVNTNMTPTNDRNMRLALRYSLNSELWRKEIAHGYSIKSSGWVPVGIPGHIDELGYDFNLTKAKQYFDRASPEVKQYVSTHGVDYYMEPGVTLDKEGALMWKDDLAKIGITLNIIETDESTRYSLMTTPPGVPLIDYAWYMDYPDAYDFLQTSATYYFPGPPYYGYNCAYMGNKTLDDIILKVRGEMNPETRNQLIREAEKDIDWWAAWIDVGQSMGVIANGNNAQAVWVMGYDFNPVTVRGDGFYYSVYKEPNKANWVQNTPSTLNATTSMLSSAIEDLNVILRDSRGEFIEPVRWIASVDMARSLSE